MPGSDRRPDQEARAKISVLIPALHRPDLTRTCLDSLRAQSLYGQCEIIVVENDAGSGPILTKPLPENVRRLLLPRNFGFAGAINQGLKMAAGEYVLLLNNDVQLHKDCLGELTRALQMRPDLAFAVGKLMCGKDPSRLDGAGDELLLAGASYRLGSGDTDTGQFECEREPLGCCAAAALLRKSVLVTLEGLDQDFFAYLEDVDLALRSSWLGFHGAYIPQAIAYHQGSATLGQPLHPKIAFWMTRNQWLLLLKNYSLAMWFRLLPRVLCFQVLWMLLLFRHGRILAWVLGVLDALRLLPRMLRKRRLVMASRKVSGQQMLNRLRLSERQLYEWHTRRIVESRSRLLSVYFRIFGAPKAIGAVQ